MDPQWLVLGICGATCSGKSFLAQEIAKLLPNTEVINQDKYFYPENSDKHTIIPELNHINWEIMSSLDMDKMFADISSITKNNFIQTDCVNIFEEFLNKPAEEQQMVVSKNDVHSILNKLLKLNIKLLIIEGFIVFNSEPIYQMCHLRFYLKVGKETSLKRRTERIVLELPEDVPGYFDSYVWPEHIRSFEEIKQKCKGVYYLNEEELKKCVIVFDYLGFFLEKFNV